VHPELVLPALKLRSCSTHSLAKDCTISVGFPEVSKNADAAITRGSEKDKLMLFLIADTEWMKHAPLRYQGTVVVVSSCSSRLSFSVSIG
jgi:hypothetical protein